MSLHETLLCNNKKKKKKQTIFQNDFTLYLLIIADEDYGFLRFILQIYIQDNIDPTLTYVFFTQVRIESKNGIYQQRASHANAENNNVSKKKVGFLKFAFSHGEFKSLS